jgi:hypothetical protein
MDKVKWRVVLMCYTIVRTLQKLCNISHVVLSLYFINLDLFQMLSKLYAKHVNIDMAEV